MGKILIAEDDAVVREILAGAIEATGHVPLLSPDGHHALQTVQCDAKIALVLSDMVMPEMDGRMLFRAMQARFASSRRRAPPMILMSGVVGPREIADLLDEGVEAFLAKPVNLNDLRHYVVEATRGARS